MKLGEALFLKVLQQSLNALDVMRSIGNDAWARLLKDLPAPHKSRLGDDMGDSMSDFVLR